MLPGLPQATGAHMRHDTGDNSIQAWSGHGRGTPEPRGADPAGTRGTGRSTAPWQGQPPGAILPLGPGSAPGSKVTPDDPMGWHRALGISPSRSQLLKGNAGHSDNSDTGGKNLQNMLRNGSQNPNARDAVRQRGWAKTGQFTAWHSNLANYKGFWPSLGAQESTPFTGG